MEVKRCANCMEEITDSVCPYCGFHENGAVQMKYGLKRNSILHGRYLIGNVLGQGGFGITYIGFDMALNIKVAVKEYYPMGSVSRDYTQSNHLVWYSSKEGQEQMKKGCEGFLKEARRMAKIDVLPEIVRVRDTFMDNNTSYIVMDYVEGETLKAWLAKNGVMEFTECVKMLLPLMKSLGEIHKRGLIHRDISPDNIMLTPEGKVRLLDLGAAKDLKIGQNKLPESVGTSQADTIKMSQLVTKKGFSPSEQYLEDGKIGTWTDVYAMCATIYYCITGKLVPEALERLLGGDKLTFDIQMKKPLTAEAKGVLQKGLAVKPENRIRTMEELAGRLEKLVPTPGPGSEPKPVKKIVIASVAALAVMSLAIIIISSVYNNNNPSVVIDFSCLQKQASAVATVQKNIESHQSILMDDMISRELSEEEVADRWVLGKKGLARESIVTVTFLDTLNDMPGDAWDVSGEKNGSVMAWTETAGQIQEGLEGYNLYIAADGGIEAGSCNTLFACYENMTEINFNDCFHTDQTTDMYRMFYNCNSLGNLDVSSFETNNVEDMRTMFCRCSSLESLDLKNFDTRNVTNMRDMFNRCSNLKNLDLSNFNTEKLTNMYGMFRHCTNLESVDLSSFDTGNVEYMGDMFNGCSSLKTIDVSKFNTGNTTDMQSMFKDCSKLKALDLSGFNTSNVTTMYCMFTNCSSLKELRLDNFDTGSVEDMTSMFYDCNSLETLSFSESFNTSRVATMYYMFYGCRALKALDVSMFITSRVTDMNCMFAECGALRELDLSNFDTASVTIMRSMFNNCSSLGKLDISNFNTSNVTDIGCMFYGCSNLKELDLSGFDVSSVTIRDNMFVNAGITEAETGLK